MQSKLPVFFHAPHRVMFLAGATQGIAAVAWWAFDLAARHGVLFQAPDWPLPAAWIHGLLMVYGFFPFFIFGFLMTAGPRWQGAPPIKRRVYIPSFACMGLGWIGFYASLALPGLAVPALALVLLGWLLGLSELVRVARHPAEDRRHVVLAVIAQVLGALGLAVFTAFAAGGPVELARVALTGGIWFYLLPLLVTVVHRMLPFFSGMVLPKYQGTRPFWAFYTLLACFAGHGVLALAGAQQWTWLADLPAAAVTLYLSWHWQIRRSFAVRMLAVLHVAFLWLGVSLVLFAIQSAGLLLGRGMLGLAPLHALTIGFFASLLLGMASRVTLGHSGRDLRADVWTWVIFWGLQAVAVVRIAAEFVVLTGWANLSLLAALGWLAAYGWWYAKYAPAYLRPRPDGRPG